MEPVNVTPLPQMTPVESGAPRGGDPEGRFAETLDKELAAAAAGSSVEEQALLWHGLGAGDAQLPAADPTLLGADAEAAALGAETSAAELALDLAGLLHGPAAATPAALRAGEALDAKPSDTMRGLLSRIDASRAATAEDLARRAGPAGAGVEGDEIPTAITWQAPGAEIGQAGLGAEAPSTTPTSAPAGMTGLADLASRWQPAAARTDAQTTTTARVDTPIGAPGWGEAFQQRLVWLVDREQQSAELHVNPPHLGPVDVMLDLAEGSARIAFASPHALVREAIESSLADLRNALAERGLTLAESFVSADSGSAREHLAQETGRASRTVDTIEGGSAPALPAPEAPRRRGAGLVDTFA